MEGCVAKGLYLSHDGRVLVAYETTERELSVFEKHAELEAAEGDGERALATIDQGLATARETGEHISDAKLLRLRGDILSKHDPANPARAEEAFKTAIAIAKQQGARSYGLLGVACVGQGLPIVRPPGRSPRRPRRPRSTGFAPTPGDARDRGG